MPILNFPNEFYTEPTIRERNKTQRGLEKEDSVFFKGHQLHYNFIRPHQALNNYTPAHFSNIYLGLGDNKWENLLMQSLKYHNGKEGDNRIVFNFRLLYFII